MRRHRRAPSRGGALLVGALALGHAAAGGCERVSYYSVSGSSSGDPPATSAQSGGGAGSGGVTRAEVLGAVGACAATLYRDFAVAAGEFQDAAADAVIAPGAGATEEARAAWAKAIALWEQAEVIRVGPAGPSDLPEGQDLRDLIYSWPLVSRCLVEQTLVAKAYESESFSATALINVRGLAAAEYLLFYEGTDNACSPSASINASGTWAAIEPAELADRKAIYAAVVASDVAAKARAVADAWDPAHGDFGARLAAAGGGGSPFASDQLALNAVSDGMFYIEKEVKDLKLGRPLGLVDCPGASCPEAVESRYARVARDHVRNNLVGFRRVFAGCDEGGQRGFDNLLTAMGAGPVADRMSDDIEAAIAAADALADADLIHALEVDRAGVERLHAALKRITDTLKTDFVTVLDLEPPKVIEGDND